MMPSSGSVRTLCAVLLLVVGGGCASERPKVDPPAPVDFLLISIDTLRADRLGCYGYAAARTPTLDRLAGAGVVFEQVTAPTPLTLPSHATMFSGLIPPRHGVRGNEGFSLPPQVETVAEVLKRNGYQTGAFIGGLPLARAGGLDQGFDAYDDRMPGPTPGTAIPAGERYAEEVLEAAAGWLETTDRARPVFAFIHLFDPHSPYEKPLPGERSGSYDGEIAHVDRALGLFLATLQSDPRWASAVTIVTSDHGESLGEHGESTHAIFIYEATQRVPWILHGVPGITPGRRSEPVGLVDLSATLLEIAGLTVPSELDGRSVLRPPPDAEPPRDLYMESMTPKLELGWAPLRGIRRGSLKFIEAPRPELYDLAMDPSELVNLYGSEAGKAETLRATLTTIMRAERPDAMAAIDPQRSAQLRSLGYVSAPPAVPAAESELPDPKDRIELHERLRSTLTAAESGDPAASLHMFAELEPEFSGSAVFYTFWGNAAMRARKLDRALECFRKAVELDPSAQSARANLGVTLIGLRRAEDALAEFQELLARYPEHARAHFHVGALQVQLGDLPDAREHLTRFLALAPDDPLAGRARRMLEGEGGP